MAKPPKKATRKQPPSLQSMLTRFYGSMLSGPEMRQQARKDTNLAMQDSMRTLRTTYQRERERTLREQYAQGAYAGLLRGFGAEGSPESQSIKDAYARAAGLQQAESEGFIKSTTGQQQANVDVGQGTAASLAGFTGDIGTAQPGTNAGVLNYLASLPKGTFAAQAESAAKGLGRAGAEAGGQFALREAQLGQALREMQDEYTMGVTSLQAKRPGMLQEALSNYRESGRGDFATLINAFYLQNTMGKTEAEITGQYKGKPTLGARATAAEIAIDQATAASQAADRTERAAIARMNAQTSQKRARIAQQVANQDKIGASGDVTKLQQAFREDAQKYVAGIINVDKKRGRPRNAPPSKQALINAVYRIYGAPLAGKYGLTKQQVAQWAAQVVSTFPSSYWKVGTKAAAKAGTKGSGKGTSAYEG